MPDFPTMTVHECAEAFRANQISISEDILSTGIKNGLFPWAIPLCGEKHACPIIFRKKFYEWLSEKLMQQAIEIGCEE